ncbi:MAG TPA: hypothetical protein VFN27_02160 [Xanthobacteraceae bacterium]|nr:hypothetical protein [Xanthobacteraceae bacterium]
MLGFEVSGRGRKSWRALAMVCFAKLHIIPVLILTGVIFSASAARAQNATWLANPGTANFNTDANWGWIDSPSLC